MGKFSKITWHVLDKHCVNIFTLNIAFMHRFKALFGVIPPAPPSYGLFSHSLTFWKDTLTALGFCFVRLLLLYGHCCKEWLKSHCSLPTDQNNNCFL